jgi:hypothetical protein
VFRCFLFLCFLVYCLRFAAHASPSVSSTSLQASS